MSLKHCSVATLWYNYKRREGDPHYTFTSPADCTALLDMLFLYRHLTPLRKTSDTSAEVSSYNFFLVTNLSTPPNYPPSFFFHSDPLQLVRSIDPL